MKTLEQYTQVIVYKEAIVLEDIALHLRHKELPLVKYYTVVIADEGHIDRAAIWKIHPTQCRILYIALYENKLRPHAKVCYDALSVMVSNFSAKQCLYYAKNASSASFKDKWQHSIAPLPW